MHPPLTTVAVNGREMGRVGAEMLLTALLSSTPQTPREIRVPEDLIVRASTARPKTY
jgi:DNA-binding LacI/PurR family transcriptional regulator